MGPENGAWPVAGPCAQILHTHWVQYKLYKAPVNCVGGGILFLRQ